MQFSNDSSIILNHLLPKFKNIKNKNKISKISDVMDIVFEDLQSSNKYYSKIINNINELYHEMAEERDVNMFRQYETPNLKYPSSAEMQDLNLIRHVWVAGDKFYKLAALHYGDPQLWWIIAWFNKVPTESHVKKGQIVLIPKPLGKITTYLRNETNGRL